MISKTEFYKRVKRLRKIRSVTGRASYSNFTLEHDNLIFQRVNTKQYWKLNLDELYSVYKTEKYFNTVILRNHLTGRIYSPSLAILIAIKACDKDGYRKIK